MNSLDLVSIYTADDDSSVRSSARDSANATMMSRRIQPRAIDAFDRAVLAARGLNYGPQDEDGTAEIVATATADLSQARFDASTIAELDGLRESDLAAKFWSALAVNGERQAELSILVPVVALDRAGFDLASIAQRTLQASDQQFQRIVALEFSDEPQGAVVSKDSIVVRAFDKGADLEDQAMQLMAEAMQQAGRSEPERDWYQVPGF